MKKYSYYLPLLALGLLAGSCQNLVSDLNISPNNPQDAPANVMLTGVQLTDAIAQEGEGARLAGLWSGYFEGLLFQYQSHYQYIVIANDFNTPWAYCYSYTIKNARLMRQKAQAVNNKRLAGVAQVLEANAASTATDLWGDVPFVQADDDNYPNPQFEPQRQVYAEVQTLLDSAIVNLNSTAFVDFSANDIIAAGNVVRWRQAAYTLKARNYLHTKEYALALAAAQNGISTNANSLYFPHLDNTNGSNLYYQFIVEDKSGYMGVGAFANSLINPTGTRTRANSKTNEKARYGYLYTSATSLNTGSVGGAFYKTTGFPMLTYQENLLILAEADARLNGLTAGLTRLNTYRAYLATGGYLSTNYIVAANLKYDAYVAADFAAGGIENPTATAIAPDRALLREILEERYVTFVGQIEGFNDVRRTVKETDIRVPVTPNVGTQLPLRFLYPQSEVDRNSSTPNPIPGIFVPTPVNM
ncbi:MAG: SusD/RagB family nutrient-binding outer membrane lipoprotein [Janthinobacterium lividum]